MKLNDDKGRDQRLEIKKKISSLYMKCTMAAIGVFLPGSERFFIIECFRWLCFIDYFNWDKNWVPNPTNPTANRFVYKNVFFRFGVRVRRFWLFGFVERFEPFWFANPPKGFEPIQMNPLVLPSLFSNLFSF